YSSRFKKLSFLLISLLLLQFTEEKLGQAEKTELDTHFENLLSRADCTKNWTEKIYRQTEVLLQPNPGARIEEFLYEKLDRKVPPRPTNGEILGQFMLEAAKEFGPGTPYASAKCLNVNVMGEHFSHHVITIRGL
uniref:SH3-domain GRB2-like endophilin B2a n=1 Tax=Sinocyclocheilus grahami TaxID=75366 RepID=A0A672LDI8_SINGR